MGSDPGFGAEQIPTLLDTGSELDLVVSGVDAHQLETGLLTLFCRHTSASLLIQENAAPAVRDDIEAFFEVLAPEDKGRYSHDDEGPDDMPAHIRAALTNVSLSIPIVAGRLALGTWQGVYLFEHRRAPHLREVAAICSVHESVFRLRGMGNGVSDLRVDVFSPAEVPPAFERGGYCPALEGWQSKQQNRIVDCGGPIALGDKWAIEPPNRKNPARVRLTPPPAAKLAGVNYTNE